MAKFQSYHLNLSHLFSAAVFLFEINWLPESLGYNLHHT